MQKTPNKPQQRDNTETTTRLDMNDTTGEEEITLVEEEPKFRTFGPHEAGDEVSLTYKIRNSRKFDHANVTRRLQDIEQKAQRESAWGRRTLNFLEALEQIFVLFDGWIKKPFRQQPKIRQQRAAAAAPRQTLNKNPIQTAKKQTKPEKKERKKFITKKKIIGSVAAVFLIVILCFVFLGQEHRTKTGNNVSTLDSSGLKPLVLSPIIFTDLGGKPVDTKTLLIGKPIYAEFDVLMWNEQEGRQLAFSADLHVYSGQGKLEVFRPNLIQYSAPTDLQTEKVHVKTYLQLMEGAPLGEYRLSFAVREAATQRVSQKEARFSVK